MSTKAAAARNNVVVIIVRGWQIDLTGCRNTPLISHCQTSRLICRKRRWRPLREADHQSHRLVLWSKCGRRFARAMTAGGPRTRSAKAQPSPLPPAVLESILREFNDVRLRPTGDHDVPSPVIPPTEPTALPSALTTDSSKPSQSCGRVSPRTCSNCSLRCRPRISKRWSRSAP